MAERKAGEGPDNQAPARTDELPLVVAPSLSLAEEATSAPVEPPDPAGAVAPVRLKLKPPHKRRALALAAVLLAAAFGALIGSLARNWGPPTHDVVGLEERDAMQRSIKHLSRQVTLLKADLAKAEAAARARHAERHAAAPVTTGSIAGMGEAAAVPLPRPGPHPAAAASRPVVLADWSIRDVHDGYVYVQSRGDIYQVVPGAPLPGLGRVQSITRRNGHWMVVTPRGIIISAHGRRFFD